MVFELKYISLFVIIGTIYTTSPETATLMGLVKRQSQFTPVQELSLKTDFRLVKQLVAHL